MTPIPARNTPGAATTAAPPGYRWLTPRPKKSSIPSKFSISKATTPSIFPYRIESGLYYHVAGVPKGKEGKPTIMWLKDYNGDGQAWEFALFDAVACMGLPTTLIGYREAQDRVIQYPVALTVISGNQKSTRTVLWVDYLFSKRPESPGFWKYAIDYRGRAGSLDTYEVRYLPQDGKFTGQIDFHRGRLLIAPGGLPNQAGLTERPGPFRALIMGEPPLPRRPSRTPSGGGNRD